MHHEYVAGLTFQFHNLAGINRRQIFVQFGISEAGRLGLCQQIRDGVMGASDQTCSAIPRSNIRKKEYRHQPLLGGREIVTEVRAINMPEVWTRECREKDLPPAERLVGNKSIHSHE